MAAVFSEFYIFKVRFRHKSVARLLCTKPHVDTNPTMKERARLLLLQT